MAQFTTSAGIEDLTGMLNKKNRIVMRKKQFKYPNGKIFCCGPKSATKRSAGSGIRQETNLPVRELCTGGTDSGRAIEVIGELCFLLLVRLRIDARGTRKS